jgi:hypothetical protein
MVGRQADAGNQPIMRLLTWPSQVQRKVTVGSANDPLEHEADTLAEQILRSPELSFGGTRSRLAIGRKREACGIGDECRAQAAPATAPGSTQAETGTVDQVLGTPGRSLDSRS